MGSVREFLKVQTVKTWDKTMKLSQEKQKGRRGLEESLK